MRVSRLTPWTLNPKPQTPDPRSWPLTPNPRPQPLNPKPLYYIRRATLCARVLFYGMCSLTTKYVLFYALCSLPTECVLFYQAFDTLRVSRLNVFSSMECALLLQNVFSFMGCVLLLQNVFSSTRRSTLCACLVWRRCKSHAGSGFRV